MYTSPFCLFFWFLCCCDQSLVLFPWFCAPPDEFPSGNTQQAVHSTYASDNVHSCCRLHRGCRLGGGFPARPPRWRRAPGVCRVRSGDAAGVSVVTALLWQLETRNSDAAGSAARHQAESRPARNGKCRLGMSACMGLCCCMAHIAH